ncbi:coadhesin-like [Oculina patagonica]
MKILLATVIFALYTLQAQGQNKFATCGRAWTKIGCFKDNIKPSRPLPEMLLNDRDRRSKYHEPGYRLNWHRWQESTHSLACRCAQKALEKGYTVFGLQFFGECWSGPSAELNFNRDGIASADKCIMNLQSPTDCDQSSSQECVGVQKTNYIYRLIENPGPQTPDVDGNYTNWSQWTECSKTCGGGEKTRERSCSNPEPKGNGRPCVGEPEESVRCNEQECDNCDKVMDVGIIVDSSSSVRRDNYEHVKTFLIDLVDKMHVSHRMTHVGIIHYNHRAFLDWDFNADVAQNLVALKKAIQNLKYQPGGTRTDRGIEMASKELLPEDRPDVPHVLLVITDGKTSRRSKKYKDVLKPFKDENVKVIAIGVGPSVDLAELTEIADGKKENVVQVDKFDKLVMRIKEILKISCATRRLLQ